MIAHSRIHYNARRSYFSEPRSIVKSLSYPSLSSPSKVNTSHALIKRHDAWVSTDSRTPNRLVSRCVGGKHDQSSPWRMWSWPPLRAVSMVSCIRSGELGRRVRRRLPIRHTLSVQSTHGFFIIFSHMIHVDIVALTFQRTHGPPWWLVACSILTGPPIFCRGILDGSAYVWNNLYLTDLLLVILRLWREKERSYLQWMISVPEQRPDFEASLAPPIIASRWSEESLPRDRPQLRVAHHRRVEHRQPRKLETTISCGERHSVIAKNAQDRMSSLRQPCLINPQTWRVLQRKIYATYCYELVDSSFNETDVKAIARGTQFHIP